MKQNWEIKKLGDVCEIARGGSPRPIKEYITTDSDGINWIKIGDTDPSGKYIYHTAEKIKPSGLYKSRYVEEGDFLLSNSMSFGRPYILKTNGCIHDGWLVLKNYNRSLLIDFFYYMLLSPYIQEQFEVEAKGSTVRNLNTDIVSNVKIVVPPLADQHRIVAILDAKFVQIDALKAAAQKNLDNAEQLWKAQLEKEFGNKEWKMMKLGEVAKKMLAGGDAPKDDYSETKTEQYNIPIYANAVADNGLYGYTNKAIVTEPSITIAARGSGTGTVFLRNDSYYPIVRLIVVIPNTKITLQKYVYYAVGNIKIAHSGSAIPQLTIPMIKQYEIPIPPLAEQTAIVSRLDALSAQISELKAKYRRQIECCDELRQSLLRAAFEGEM